MVPAASEKIQKSPPGHGGARPGAGRPAGYSQSNPAAAYELLAKAKAKRETYQAQITEFEYRQKAAQLIEVNTYEREMASVLKIVATTIESLPDVLERDAGISGEAIIRAQLVCDGMRETLYRKLRALTEKDDGKS